MVFDLFGCGGVVFLEHRSMYKILCAVCCRSIKHYFLLDKGDFIVQFMDMTEEEMKQNIDDILLYAAMLCQQNKKYRLPYDDNGRFLAEEDLGRLILLSIMGNRTSDTKVLLCRLDRLFFV